MADATSRHDPDRPPGGGIIAGAHLRAGRLLVNAVNLLRPRVTLGVRLVALDADGLVFLVRHSYLPGYHLPGGGVSPGETCREAVIRESREEGGLELATPPDLFGVYLNRVLAARDHVVLFVARGAMASGRPPRGLETLEAGFFEPAGLPDGTTPATRARIEEVLFGRVPSEDW
jgi:ADP-ribose pyrophosphatase YjhB (NUDIX family)